jgi:hypothetical protein
MGVEPLLVTLELRQDFFYKPQSLSHLKTSGETVTLHFWLLQIVDLVGE